MAKQQKEKQISFPIRTETKPKIKYSTNYLQKEGVMLQLFIQVTTVTQKINSSTQKRKRSTTKRSSSSSLCIKRIKQGGLRLQINTYHMKQATTGTSDRPHFVLPPSFGNSGFRRGYQRTLRGVGGRVRVEGGPGRAIGRRRGDRRRRQTYPARAVGGRRATDERIIRHHCQNLRYFALQLIDLLLLSAVRACTETSQCESCKLVDTTHSL